MDTPHACQVCPKLFFFEWSAPNATNFAETQGDRNFNKGAASIRPKFARNEDLERDSRTKGTAISGEIGEPQESITHRVAPSRGHACEQEEKRNTEK